MTSITTRRAVLAGVPAIAIAPAAAIAAIEPDPIYDVIAEHEAAYGPCRKSEERADALEETSDNREGRQLVCVYFDPNEDWSGWAPEWVAAATDFSRCWHRYQAAQWRLAETVPTTHAGLMAMLSFIGKHQARERKRFAENYAYYGWPICRYGRTHEEDTDQDGVWFGTLLDNIAKAADTLAVQS